MAEALNEALSEHNIQVTACCEGQAVGQENNVGVFDIQQIKGLKFEGVFFVGIGELAALQPSLFDKYLYVGTARAATGLGGDLRRCRAARNREPVRPLWPGLASA
ncbi:ATP-binding domain-containing protein [Corticibacter populi]|uniref:ATP-binding domain-containing protein n=1 Tax=Corticibacter populi TaxID=1550736 RepID=UPI001A911035|nr:ATP-binding domain-containing protein [Corticibacter populi]